ncbi:MAG: FAD-dependent oxidoreductase, partial [Pseudomonadota bacterium]|nr:FAD-dependent oxidoreductase [Pseudomonadota bacterium]
MSIVSRRRFLSASLALALLPHGVRAEFGSQPDIVVVGAGAAGLAATQTLLEHGANVLLIESSNRIGGRAVTDTTIFGTPYDLGASWLHAAHLNPFVTYGQNHGFDIYPEPGGYTYFIGNQQAGEKETAKVEHLYRSAYQAIARAGRRGKDISASEAIGNDLLNASWGPTVAAEIGSWEMGADLDSFSSLDWWNMEDGVNYFCRQGFGTLLSHYGRDIPVSLNTIVTGID